MLIRLITCKAAPLLSLSVALLLANACDVQREVYDYDDDAELQAYIHQEPVARELFRRDSLFLGTPYTRPGDSAGVYQEFVDSSYRNINISGEVDGDFVGTFGPVPFAEVVVTDQFLIRTERTTDQGVDTAYDWRALIRAGFFLQLGNPNDQAFSGWVLRGFYGGTPRVGTMIAQRDDGFSFRVDALDQKTYRYVRYREVMIIDTTILQNGYVWIDTTIIQSPVPHETNLRYIDLANLAQPQRGDMLAIIGRDMDGGPEAGTVYTLMATEQDDGWYISRMAHPSLQTYQDTLVVPRQSDNFYHLILFQERQYPDRHGAIWVAPYRYLR